MCIICDTPEKNQLIGMTRLDCSKCQRITSIPTELTNLTFLDCSNCPNLTHLPPSFVKLQAIYCYNCPLITYIPKEYTHLNFLWCNNCPLTEIPSVTPEYIPDTNCSIIQGPDGKYIRKESGRLLKKLLIVREKIDCDCERMLNPIINSKCIRCAKVFHL